MEGIMHRARRILLVLAVLFLISSPAIATTYYVPDDFSTIQAALDAATGGDIIVVRDGTYTGAGNKNLDFKGKALTLQSENGPETCIIDCEGSGRAFYFHSGEASTSIINGFTFMNGRANYGGSIYCSSSSPTISNCYIRGNAADIDGGGIYCRDSSSPTIGNCTIDGNSALNYNGGGIYCVFSSSPIITNCIFTENWTNHSGGGIHLTAGSSAKISNCIINNNVAHIYHGGGIVCADHSSPTILNCTISGNSASSQGGGIYCRDPSSPIISNCTISDNTAGVTSGGLYSENSSPAVNGCIFWQDAAPTAPEIGLYLFASVTVAFSDIEGGAMAVYADSGSTLDWESGNIDADPLFMGASDYHLSIGSPCIDAGIDIGIYEDIDGDIRPQGEGFDIGADEFVFAPSLLQINLQSPTDGSILSAPPIFTWIADAGESNAYAVDFSLPPLVPFWSTYENMHLIIYDTTWTMPLWMWDRIPSGKRVYWRVRGVDLSLKPLSVIESDEVWSFYKE
ncbi:MAG: hypothetical protein C4520_00485 [Candidatus Abyssobacteria bacterium SURF_5]|uniref:Carbohydrate-binding/sugar hydrolysis domain-containing protein n=1 Tax=Abyssobacteria bacterium (strain SURF_5) TaxID=2093360 RepID=A0A3A4PB66_ABYX5|nr:MAG: hypothetical protein C4520_00485 [Candidatus Abyssubacteria bacterium SURF_5]